MEESGIEVGYEWTLERRSTRKLMSEICPPGYESRAYCGSLVKLFRGEDSLHCAQQRVTLALFLSRPVSKR